MVHVLQGVTMIDQRISLRAVERPQVPGTEEKFSWFCESLGLTHGRDLDTTAERVVLQILEEVAEEPGVSSARIAEKLAVTPARVNHHVRNLVATGLLYRRKKLIYLRGGSLAAAVVEMKKDADRIFDELVAVAEVLDREIVRH
ncbi:winged helix-turn-helix transcriptional regulator [Methanofollis ethanolicus]|uniref:winged helix-turn-helix transcriptional regulator n=1 Tax=Methanofollis ethanolicus TaxID=488124 RepID=UPI001F344F33|nr:winged helix-turn-helix transcriptional regulator [Methanofollis ethanolicus]